MRRAQNRDAVHRERFYFRKYVFLEDDEEEEGEEEWVGPKTDQTFCKTHDHEFTEMTLDTIVNGKV